MAGMSVRFWGVRGSLATPGSTTSRYGGNTSCVEVTVGREHLIFDMGSGVRELGATLERKPGVRATFFLSHYHWDHIQGLPFFGPAFNDSKAVLTVYGATRLGRTVREILAGQMIDPYFPIDIGTMKARLIFRDIEDGAEVRVGPAVVSAREMRHPGGSLAFRVESDAGVFVYATDLEHGPHTTAPLMSFARDADILVYDATYTESEYRRHKGWGHSTWVEGTRIAKAAGVKRLVLFHHDPSHDDAQLDLIVKAARKHFPATDVAQEGKVYRLGGRSVTARRPIRAAAKRVGRK
jgi:phosphoribosyl 1,2-cyclic phosphodiesterase